MTDPTLTRTLVNAFLDDYYKSQIERAATASPHYKRLWKTMLDVHLAGGKRLRPYMVLLSYQTFGGKNHEAVLPVACALELVHGSMLMHDDIIDRDYVRHGQPNVAGAYRQTYQGAEHTDHLANSAALLAGDLLLSAAYQLILASSLDQTDKIAAATYLDEVIFTVVGGELLDLELVLTSFEAADPLTVARLKTAEYSFVMPLVIGARLAGAPKKQEASLRVFGNALGTAFQLMDDLLDIFGQAADIGKPVASDITEAKRTYIMQTAYKTATVSQKQKLDQLLGKAHLTSAQIKNVQSILESCGAKAATEEAIAQYADQAYRVLAQMPLDDKALTEFEGLVNMAVNRRT